MDNEEAKFLLGACRPGGADAQNPQMQEAHRQAQCDAQLGAWLAAERAFDAAIARKLREKEPPANLRARLLAGVRVSAPGAWRRRAAWWTATAAALALLAGGVLWRGLAPWSSSSGEAPMAGVAAPLADWQRESVAIFGSPFFRLDLTGGEYPPLEKHLLARGALVADALPFLEGRLAPIGCKVLEWRGQVVSLTCFTAQGGELVHLFVIPRGGIDERDLRGGRRQAAKTGEYATLTWLAGDRIMMVASRLPSAELERVVVGGAEVAAAYPRSGVGDAARQSRG